MNPDRAMWFPPSLFGAGATAKAAPPRPPSVPAEGRALPVRKIETVLSEGNLAELPLFVLSNKAARPYRWAEVEENGVKTKKKVFVREDYEKTILLDDPSRPQVRSVTLKAHPGYGFPTTFARNCLLAVMQKAETLGLFDPKKTNCDVIPIVPITRYELARANNCLTPGKAIYEDIDNACNAMRFLALELRHVWYDVATKTRRQEFTTSGLLAEVRFGEPGHADRAEGNGLGTAQRPRSYVQLGNAFFHSVRDGYAQRVALEYINALKHPLAEELYIYLTKKDGNMRYRENLRSLCAKVGLSGTKPAKLKESLRPALQRLQSPLLVEKLDQRFAFLSEFQFEGDILSVAYNPDAKQYLESIRRSLAG